MADVRTPELVINKLTKQQYENIQNPSDTEIYLVPEDEEHKPICYPTTASEVKTTSMVVKSSVSDNGKILTENGFVYNTSGNPTISDTKITCDLGVGFFEKKLENLTMNTEYHIKSYGQNASGLVYGSELVQRTRYSPIPIEYQLVEYLESGGSQYLRMNVNFNWFKIKCMSNSGIIFGSTLTQPSFYFTGTQILNANYLFGNKYWVDTTSILNPHTYETNNSELLKDGGFYHLIENIINTGQLDLFRYTRDTGNFYYATGKIYFLHLSDNGNYTSKLYPVYRIADNKPGMYDIVNGVFYTNQGTGEFTVGPDKPWSE